MVIIIIFKKTSTYNVSLPLFFFLLRANSLLFSAEKHLNVHFPTFLLSYFLYFYYQTSPQPPPTNATPLRNCGTFRQKSPGKVPEITATSSGNHGNFLKKSPQ